MVIKQIYFDEDSGKLYLADDQNNNYLCNIYGDKLTEFVPGVSGVVSQSERGIKKTYNISNRQYLPSIRFFEGYSHFPRPILRPLDNVKMNNKEKLICLLKSRFNCEKVLDLFNLKTNIGLPYLTGQLVNDESKSNRVKLIKLIDDYFEEYKMVNKYKLNLMPKDPLIKALKRFKKLLLENIDINIVHGRTLNQPSDYVKNKYSEISAKLQKKTKKIKKEINQVIGNSINEYKDELSFLSYESENDRKYASNNIIKVKDNKFFKNSLEVEKKYIEGFKPPIKKEEGIIQKPVKRNLKTNGELYLQDMNLFKRGNISVNRS